MADDKEEAIWRQAAACRHADPDLFFPISSGGLAVEQIATAKTYCERCPAIKSCLEFALRTRQLHGVWGGTTEDERVSLLRRGALGAISVLLQLPPGPDSLAG